MEPRSTPERIDYDYDYEQEHEHEHEQEQEQEQEYEQEVRESGSVIALAQVPRDCRAR